MSRSKASHDKPEVSVKQLKVRQENRSPDDISLDIIHTADAHLTWLMSEQITRALTGDEVKQLKTLFEIVQTHRAYIRQQEIQAQLQQLMNPSAMIHIESMDEARQLARGKS